MLTLRAFIHGLTFRNYVHLKFKETNDHPFNFVVQLSVGEFGILIGIAALSNNRILYCFCSITCTFDCWHLILIFLPFAYE